MNRTCIVFIFAAFCFSLAIPAMAEFEELGYDPLNFLDNAEFEVGVISGYSGSLLNDYTMTSDRNYTPSVAMRYYPTSFLGLSYENEYTYYSDTYRLSNYYGKLGITLIPTDSKSAFSFYFNGSYDFRAYQQSIRNFDNYNFDVMISMGYRAAEQLHFRMGYDFNANTYFHASNSNLIKYETFMGGNWTMFGSNTLDLELGYSITSYSAIIDTFMPPVIDTVYSGRNANDYFSKTYLLAFYVSPRFSRSLGEKTGMSLEFNYQKFSNADKSVIIISEFEHISPFAGVTEGRSITLNLKTFLIKNAIVSSGAGYWHKTYLRMFDGPYETTRIDRAKKRVDELSHWFISLELPVPVGHSELLKSTWSLDYYNNVSNFDQFKYYKWAFSTGLTVQF
jgi:hypothetical protein